MDPHVLTSALVGLLAAWALFRNINAPTCMQCQGRGDHRKDCPWRR